MAFANPLGLALLGLLIPIIAMHILRPRREERPVSSTYLWQRMDRPVTATTPWQRLRGSWLLLAQLLAVIGLALLVANPVRVGDTALAEHTVFLIDASGSMTATDGEPDRAADAIERAKQVYGDLPDGAVASVIEVGAVPRVLLTTSDDRADFDSAVDRVSAGTGAADFEQAFALAEGLETPDASIGFVLVSDGGLSAEELRLVPAGLTYEPIGSMATNRAITDLRVEPRPDGLLASITVEHTGGPAATQTVRLDVDGRTQFTTEISLDRDQREVIDVELGAGDEVEAFLEGQDLLALDNRRWAVAGRRSALDVAVIGAGDPFLLAMLDSIDGVSLLTVDTLDEYESQLAEGAIEPANVFVFDRIAVPDTPPGPFLAIATPGGVTGVSPTGTVDLPVVSLVRTGDALLRDVDLTALAISQAQRVTTTAVDVLVGAESAPLLVRGRQAGQPFLYLTFAPASSNLPVQLGYPILGDRIFAELGGSALPPTDLLVGQPLRIPNEQATITDPSGNSFTFTLGDPTPIAQQAGLWTFASPGLPEQVVAVNPDPAESRLSTAAAVPSALREVRPGTEPPRNEQSLRPWIAAAMLAVLVAEWLLARRHVGVSRRQWRFAQVLRAIIAAALIATLFNAGFDRSQNRVATVFVLDVSDSMGAAGRAEALTWVQQALADQPDDAQAGVVLFGGDARIEALVQQDLALGQPTVQVDADQTDLASALRLGAAILPDDAKRRVVLLSDGRATVGDVADEAARLGSEGVVVDVRLIGGQLADDTAVQSIDAPGYVRDGEAIEVRATIRAGKAGDGALTLLRDGEIIDASIVSLQAGLNNISVLDPAPEPGLHRYEVQIRVGDDPVPENDRAFAPVQVGESRGVLILEGVSGNAEVLAAALEAGGTPTTIRSAGSIGGIEDLLTYDATVLVDVSARDLSPAQVGALTSSVRDTGRGLVTIGGLQSYGLGGYLGSELETVLPVVSDVLDPQRRQTVAEVLAIDTSGSMGACHCADGFESQGRDLGGVNKTDIARAGAARAIESLSPSDEVGVLAFDVEDRWVVDLQALPPADVVAEGLGSLVPNGGTNMLSTLESAAIELRASDASLKHIILFSDGFTEPGALGELAAEAKVLFEEEGITTSVIATGEGAADELRPIAEAGGGRFYPGRDLDRIPEIIVEEALQAARSYIVEGEFLPQITSNDQAVRSLTSAPPLLGYIASSTKPTASTLLRIGPDGDPLLASWQVGLGTATSWTSDASRRWSQNWATWDGYVEFWNNVVRDTFPSPAGDVETRAQVQGDLLYIEVDSSQVFDDGEQALARVTTPQGQSIEVPLDRVSPTTFAAELPVDEQGVYAVGTSVVGADGSASVAGTALAARSYSAEYRPGQPDASTLERIADATGGRTDVQAATAFDGNGLTPGSSRFSLVPWLLLFAALAWPIAVALSRVAVRRGATFVRDPQAADTNAALRVRRAQVADEADAHSAEPDDAPATPSTAPQTLSSQTPSSQTPSSQTSTEPAATPVSEAGPSPAPAPSPPVSDAPDGGSTSTLDALLARKRRSEGET